MFKLSSSGIVVVVVVVVVYTNDYPHRYIVEAGLERCK